MAYCKLLWAGLCAQCVCAVLDIRRMILNVCGTILDIKRTVLDICGTILDIAGTRLEVHCTVLYYHRKV